MQIILIRHAAVEIDQAAPPSSWQLSDEGRAGARLLAQDPIWLPIERIFSSPEPKAFETAHILAGPNGMSVSVVENLHEVVRPPNQWFGEEYPGGYRGAVEAYFAEPSQTTHGWETPAAAQRRIRRCIDTLREWEPGDFAVVGHGLTLSLYIASVTGLDPAVIWPAIQLPDYAILDLVDGRMPRPFGELFQRASAVNLA
jgi:broad specificity phosphatase PhoE